MSLDEPVEARNFPRGGVDDVSGAVGATAALGFLEVFPMVDCRSGREVVGESRRARLLDVGRKGRGQLEILDVKGRLSSPPSRPFR